MLYTYYVCELLYPLFSMSGSTLPEIVYEINLIPLISSFQLDFCDFQAPEINAPSSHLVSYDVCSKRQRWSWRYNERVFVIKVYTHVHIAKTSFSATYSKAEFRLSYSTKQPCKFTHKSLTDRTSSPLGTSKQFLVH